MQNQSSPHSNYNTRKSSHPNQIINTGVSSVRRRTVSPRGRAESSSVSRSTSQSKAPTGLHGHDLNEEQLRYIAAHVYNVNGRSFLEDLVMQRFWNAIINYVPLWCAPNAITLVGLLLNLAGTLLLIYFNPDAKHAENIPAWAYVANALSLFVYQTLDALDGKQARRTGSASPLGEIFDHGCDAFSTVFVITSLLVGVGMGQHVWLMLALMVAAQLTFYAVHWQCYCVGAIQFHRFDITEAQWATILWTLLSAFFGPEIWAFDMPYLGAPWRMALLAVYVPSVVWVGALTYYTVFVRGGVGKNRSTVAGTSVLSPGFPVALLSVAAFVIAAKSHAALLELHPTLYCATFSLAFAKLCNQLIIAHMAHSELKLFDVVMLGPLALALFQYLELAFVPEHYVLWAVFIYSILDTLYHSVRLCNCIACYLNIQVFKITPTPVPATATVVSATSNGNASTVGGAQRAPDSDGPLTLKSLAEDGPGRSIRRLVRRVRTLYRRYRGERSGSAGDDEADDSSPDSSTRWPAASSRVLSAASASASAAASGGSSASSKSFSSSSSSSSTLLTAPASAMNPTPEPSGNSTALSSTESGHASASELSASDQQPVLSTGRISAHERRTSRKSKI